MATAPAARLKKYCLGFPEAVEEFPWGESAFKVRKKVFCFLSLTEEGLSVTVKLPHSQGPALMFNFASPCGYGLGKSGWVTTRFGPKEKPPVELLESWIEESYRAIAPKALSRTLD